MVVGNGAGARGIVIWNGMKTNINITGNMVNNNNCCGIELQDGNASDVDISNNTLDIGSGDNALGITGLNPSVGPNTINNNTITGGGRYGIEIKNPAGSVTASGNMITLVSQNGDLRDRAGIAIMRRGVQAGNADVPNGVTLTGNTIDGYQQSSVSEGFGIVVEGTNHTVTGNTVTNCEVGILQQQNPSGYPGDADQSNLADLYFGRANSPITCGNTISGNTFSGNGLDTRNLGVGFGLVTNTNSGEYFCSIQSAINDAQTLTGHNLLVGSGIYNEAITVDKSLTLQGASADKTLYVIDGTGLGTNSGIILNVGITNVTIQNLTVQDFTGASGNANAGIYGVGGNDNLTVTNVALLNNITASGFYANGPITNVNITNSMVVGNGAGARGIVIWNGMKTNINITGNMVNNNNCCGIELQDGNASDVDVSNNTLDIGSGDNALGITGLNPSVGPNTINNNTITGGGRYGIEIKNPAGGVTASGNMITLVSQNGDLRDRAGIAIMRRGVQAGNADVPNGVTLTSNTIDGYQQSSVSEGFGIVVEGTNHTVTGNTVTNCEVGILQQQNPSGYPGDADQSNLADLYFGRANSPMTCGNTISGNTFSGNGADTRNLGVGSGLVTNTNTVEYFCSIQSAIDDAQTLDGHTLEISPGTYNEQVLVTKGVTLKGVGVTRPEINFTGTPTGDLAILRVLADGVTIESMHYNVDLSKLRSAIIASATGLDNITINDNVIDAYGTPAGSYGDRNAVSVNYGGPTNFRVATGGVNNVVFTNNTVNGTGPGSYFRSGLSLDEGGGTMTGNTLTTINHDLLVRFAGNGPVTMTGNMFNGGGVELSDQNAAAGLFTLSGNTFTGVGAPSTAVLRIRNNYNSIAHSVTNNNFNGYEWGVSLENMNSITPGWQYFSTASPTANAVVINTKSISSNSGLITQVPVGGSFLNNNFNGTGTGPLFVNHDSDNDSYGSFVLGTAGNENDFTSSLSSFITLDGQTGSTNGSTFPVYPITGDWPTTMDYWAFDMDAVNNNFDVGAGLQLPSAMSFAQLSALEDKVFHTMDVAPLGLVLLNNNNLYVSPALTPTASDNDYTRIKKCHRVCTQILLRLT
ncbi:MAG: right-handed parallel beta-helix repeat-containing protein [Saprospiraceae bacterium]|nr:right-handed parallel beta-helix repeat-containing protein [Saprospiraceae bacterium]